MSGTLAIIIASLCSLPSVCTIAEIEENSITVYRTSQQRAYRLNNYKRQSHGIQRHVLTYDEEQDSWSIK